MICLVALVVFGILGIFSARYRQLAKESFDCVFRRITLRPCQAEFNKKMQAKAVWKLSKLSPKLGTIVYKYFEVFSWLLTVFLIISMVFAANGLYNLSVHGTCDPNGGACIFTDGVSCGSEHCENKGCSCEGGNCTEENNFTACEGNCTCIEGTCG